MGTLAHSRPGSECVLVSAQTPRSGLGFSRGLRQLRVTLSFAASGLGLKNGGERDRLS